MEKIIVKKYSFEGIFYGIIILLIIIGFILLTFFLPMIQQSGHKLNPSEPDIIIKKNITFISYLIFIVFILGVVIILLKTPLWGGLNDLEREVLKFIYISNKEKKNRYNLMKELRKKEIFKNKDKSQMYRMFKKLKNCGYINYNNKSSPYLTELGISTIRILNKNEY